MRRRSPLTLHSAVVNTTPKGVVRVVARDKKLGSAEIHYTPLLNLGPRFVLAEEPPTLQLEMASAKPVAAAGESGWAGWNRPQAATHDGASPLPVLAHRDVASSPLMSACHRPCKHVTIADPMNQASELISRPLPLSCGVCRRGDGEAGG